MKPSIFTWLPSSPILSPSASRWTILSCIHSHSTLSCNFHLISLFIKRWQCWSATTAMWGRSQATKLTGRASSWSRQRRGDAIESFAQIGSFWNIEFNSSQSLSFSDFCDSVHLILVWISRSSTSPLSKDILMNKVAFYQTNLILDKKWKIR